MDILLTPSILSADLAHLQDEVSSIESQADWLQVDVMDGHFVPNLSFGAPVIRCLKTSLPLDIHLMVSNPLARLHDFAPLHPYNTTFHAEAVPATEDRRALMTAIRATGSRVGIALNPPTPLEEIDDVMAEVDLLLIMSVHPGFGGQTFLSEVLEKVRAAREKYPSLMIQIDGGINAAHAAESIQAGATNIVAGSSIFSADNRSRALADLLKACEQK